MKTCINCGYESDRAHCPECGQKLEIPKLNWRSIGDEISVHWLGFNNMFFRVVKQLTLKPEKVIRAYIEGNRVHYIGPLGYIVVMSALYIIAFDFIRINPEDVFGQTQEDMIGPLMDTAEAQDRILAINQKLAEYIRILPVINIPFFAFGVWLLFIKRGRNYIENVVLISYVQGQLLWLSILMLIIYKATGTYFIITGLVLGIAYQVYTITRFYYNKSYIKTVFRSLISILLAYIAYMVFALLLGLAIGFMYNLSK